MATNRNNCETSNNTAALLINESKDEVDFVLTKCNNIYNNNNIDNNTNYNANKVSTNKKADNRVLLNSENVPKSAKNSTHNIQNYVPNTQTTTTINNSTKNNNNKTKSGENTELKKQTTKERLSLFSFSSKKSNQKATAFTTATVRPTPTEKENGTQNASISCTQTTPTTNVYSEPPVPIGTPPRQHKFVKSSSIARLLGNTYNAKKVEKVEKEEQKRQNRGDGAKFNTFGGRRRSNGAYLERFKKYAKEDGDVVANGVITLTTDSRDLFGGSRNELVSVTHVQEDRNEDLGAKAFRTISRGLGKLWFKRTHSVEISSPDPEFKVSYLGNVLTGWAKGEGCVEKQLNTLWRNYTQNNKPDVIMRIKVCASGLKATTRQHGLTEYWANRITHCCAPKNYPRVFCWVYRHEGRKLKHELRCHAVLCSKEKVVQELCNTLKENLESALREFKREKILKQNARLSLANAAYDNPSLPRRKILLSVGGNNYRPPLERSKSAPKLMAIEEAIGEEDGDEIEETNEPEMKSCCQKDSLYPAMTLGRRRCRRGHSIRRTGKVRSTYNDLVEHEHGSGCCKNTKEINTSTITNANANATSTTSTTVNEQRHSYGSDESDEFDKLLKYNNYDSNASLTNELLPYFDMQLHKNTSASLGSLTELRDETEPLSLLPTINSDPSADPEGDFNPNDNSNDLVEPEILGIRRNGVCSDGEEDYLDADDMYFRQASILNMLHRNSMRKMTNLSMSSDESSIETNASAPLQYHHQMQSSISSNASSITTNASTTDSTTQQKPFNPDSDEGSISSGCETASIATANQDDISLQYQQQYKQLISQHSAPAALQYVEQLQENSVLHEEPITVEEIYQRLESRLKGRNNSDATTFSSSSSITLKLGNSPTASMNGLDNLNGGLNRTRRIRRQQKPQNDNDSDSECSDESGYVEFQEKEKAIKRAIGAANGNGQTKPQPPPKPMPRRLLSATQKQTITSV
ncbi:uncharacterized protein LOC119678740 [Teleopsis dalmanni]|uniref:uncharacterized protein LOC119678740 n=1 Tax=Teleopsis dalmanni TaxID=139649 RepID=UPI0018CFD4B3|nr:uncharacterized protein LOC119678740 [Teleopsis dalmanni]